MLLAERFVPITSGCVDTTVKFFEAVLNYRGALTIAVLGILALFSVIFIAVFNPYDLIFRWKLTFADGGEIFELWKTPPVELYLKVYLWNVTNKEEYMSGIDDKLKIVDVGPYVYRELLKHENITFNDNGTLTAVPKHPLVWVPELSEGRSEDDLLILPNIALLSIADVVAGASIFTRLGLNMVIRQTKSEPLVQMTAKEFMLGYKSPLMTLGNQFMPSWIYFDKLGLIDRMYDFDGDYETVYTGTKYGLENIGLIDKYNGDVKLPQWDMPCGGVTGASDGTKFPGYIQPNDTLLFYRKSMCRAKNLVKINETVEAGLDAYVYTFASDADDNGRYLEKNKCFCKNQKKCLPPGLLDVRGCYYGFPIALSYPHFLDGDEVLNAKVEGSYPDEEKHRSIFIIQPESGLPIKIAARYQINMAIGNVKNIANSAKFSEMVLPLLWFEIGMYGLPTSLALRFRLYLNILPTGQTCLMYGLLVSGVLFLLYSIHKFVRSRLHRDALASPWVEDALVMNIDRKLSSYLPERDSDSRRAMTAKELEVFMEALASPMQAEIKRE